MSAIRSQPSNSAYRRGWDRIFGGYAPRTRCFMCSTERDGNLEKCPECGSRWLEKKFANGIYAVDARNGEVVSSLMQPDWRDKEAENAKKWR